MASSNESDSNIINGTDDPWELDSFSVDELEDLYSRMKLMNGEQLYNFLSSLQQRMVDTELKLGDCLMDRSPNYTLKSVQARIKAVPKCKTRITFSGPNSSGKSTLLQSLVVDFLSHQFLPSRSGFVTGRICEISYCRPEEACVSVIPLYLNSEKTKTYRLDVNASLGPQLSPYLERPGDLNEISSWSKFIVRVQWPFSRLKDTNVEFIDLPGFSTSSDLPEMKSNVNHYLSQTEMHGVVFCYDNPILADDAINAFLELKKLLLKRQKITKGALLPIFFASTKFNFISALEEDTPLNHAIRQTVENRWFLFSTAAKKHIALGITDHIDINAHFGESKNWSLACAHTFLIRNEDYQDCCSDIENLHTHFKTRLLRWMVQIKAQHQIRYINMLITNSTAFYERSLLATTNKLPLDEKNFTIATIDKYTNKVLGLCKSMASEAGDCFLKTVNSQELKSQLEQHFEKFDIQNAPDYAPVAFSGPVMQAAEALATEYGLKRLAPSPFRLSVSQLTLEISKFMARFVYRKCVSTYCEQWVEKAIQILASHFSRPDREMTLLHRALGNIVNISEFFRGLQEGSKAIDAQKADSFPDFLQNMGFNSLLQHLERFITETLQKGLAKITRQTFEESENTASIIRKCLFTAKLLPFANLQQVLCSIMIKIQMKLQEAVEHETEVTSSWATQIPRFREFMLYEQHAISITQCWNACQLYNAISDQERCPSVSSLKYSYVPPSSPLILPPVISSLQIPSFGYEFRPDAGSLQHTIPELSASYLATLVNMIELYRSIPCYKTSSILFPSHIRVWYDFKTSKLSAQEIYEKTCSALPLSSSDVVNVLIAAIETVQIMSNTSGRQLVQLPTNDITILEHEPHYLVGRASLCTLPSAHSDVLQRAQITNSSKLEIFEFLARELITTTAQASRSSRQCPIEEFTLIWSILNDPKSKLDEDAALQQILANLKELRP